MLFIFQPVDQQISRGFLLGWNPREIIRPMEKCAGNAGRGSVVAINVYINQSRSGLILAFSTQEAVTVCLLWQFPDPLSHFRRQWRSSGAVYIRRFVFVIVLRFTTFHHVSPHFTRGFVFAIVSCFTMFHHVSPHVSPCFTSIKICRKICGYTWDVEKYAGIRGWRCLFFNPHNCYAGPRRNMPILLSCQGSFLHCLRDDNDFIWTACIIFMHFFMHSWHGVLHDSWLSADCLQNQKFSNDHTFSEFGKYNTFVYFLYFLYILYF